MGNSTFRILFRLLLDNPCFNLIFFFKKTGLQNFWAFDGATNDQVGQMNLTVVNSSLVNWTTDRFGNPKSALDFNNSYNQAPAGVYFDPATGGFTVMTWLKLNSLNAFQRIIDFGNGVPMDNMIYSFTTVPYFAICNGALCTTYHALIPLIKDVWTHLAFSVQGTTGSFYTNGVLDSTFPGKE